MPTTTEPNQISKPIYRVLELLCEIVQDLPIGTNLAVLHLQWTILSGHLLVTRGAIFPALLLAGLSVAATGRAWSGLAKGCWQIDQLLEAFARIVQREGRWHPRRHGGYQALPVDTTAFYRPRLQHCPTKHYNAQAGKALPAIPFGLIARVGAVELHRLAHLVGIVRADPKDPSEPALQRRTLAQAVALSTAEDVIVTDRGFKVAQLQATGVQRYVARASRNFTARRAQPPAYQGRGAKPKRGAYVRPLARHYKDRMIAATPSDESTTWSDGGHTGKAEIWRDLVLPDAAPGDPTFDVVVLYDERFDEPLVLVSPLRISPSDLRALYLDRWPVEHSPLVAKQLLGAHRQFVFGEESRQRLPELALFAATLLAYVAATCEAVATGFWDRAPQRTAGRLRRVLARTIFPANFPLLADIRKKASQTDHLPKGVNAHRRVPNPT
jgi:hypothetical protein